MPRKVGAPHMPTLSRADSADSRVILATFSPRLEPAGAVVTTEHRLPWLVAVAVALVTGCTGSRTAGAVGGRASTPPTMLSCETPDSVAESGHRALVDLTCSGHRDTVQVTWDSTGGTLRPAVTVRRHNRIDRMLLNSDGLPELVAFADLDENGTRDIILATLDESSVLAGIVLLYRDSLAVPRVRSRFDWLGFQFTFAGNVVSDSCYRFLRPFATTSRGGIVLSVAYGNSANHDCRHPPRALYKIVKDSMVPAG